ncbi:MATE efflux family protein, partial [Coemansia reversa NRRL 1564]
LQTSFLFVNVISVGHLGTGELAGMAMSVLINGFLVYAPSLGLVSATETFCSTAYTASRDKTLVGFHFQRGLLASVLHLIVVAPILWNLELILLSIGQNPLVAKLSGTYMRIQVFGVLPWTMFEACKCYLQSQGIMRAGSLVLLVVVPIHCFNNYLLVRSPTYGIGFIGAPIATLISEWLMFAGIVIYIRGSRAMDTWGGWNIDVLHNMHAYYKVAAPAVIMLCAEYFAFGLLTIGASYFGVVQIDACTIVINTLLLIFIPSYGISFSTGPRVGNLIGAAKPRQARIASDVALAASAFIGLLFIALLAMFLDLWISVYTAEPDVIRQVKMIIPITYLFITGDGLKAVLSAIMRGLGRQKVSAAINMLAYHLIAIPVSAYLGFGRDMQNPGLWWGVCVGVLVVCGGHFIYIYRWVDWKDEVRFCLVRL